MQKKNTAFEENLKRSEKEYFELLHMIECMYGGDVDPYTCEHFKDELNQNIGSELLHVTQMYDGFGIELDADFTPAIRELRERVLREEVL